jgi:hypothetical protein
MHVVHAAKAQVPSPRDSIPAFELRFRAISPDGSDISFACDCLGRVSLDELGESGLESYLYARTVIGREFHAPVVISAACAASSAATAPNDMPTPSEGFP